LTPPPTLETTKDLGIDDEKCKDVPFAPGMPVTVRVPKSCTDKTVIDAMLIKAGDPSSFMNSHGPSPELLLNRLGPAVTGSQSVSKGLDLLMNCKSPAGQMKSLAGASMFQRFDDAFFTKLLNTTVEGANHLQHVAALQVHPDDTAYPWRNAALMVEYDSSDEAKEFLSLLVEGGYTPQGYYAYLSPIGMKKWRSYFFDDKWRKLADIRAKYDPKDVFGKPLTIESIGE